MSTHYKLEFQHDTPHDAKDATPIAFEDVLNAHVVHVLDAEHRNAHLTGTFQLAEGQAGLAPDAEVFRAHCYWFGCKPETRWMSIKVKPNQWIEQKNYSGPVIRNIGRIGRNT